MTRSFTARCLAATVIAVGWLAASALAPVAAATPTASTTAQKQQATGQVYVVQGLPGTQVSVDIDGEAIRTDVGAASILGPFTLTSGRHVLSVTGAEPAWMLDVAVDVRAGQSTDLVIHRPASVSGRPLVTAYRLPLGPVARDSGRVLVAHAATVPPADVLVDGDVAFANIANGEFLRAVLPAGTHRAEIVPTGRSTPVLLGPVDVEVEPSTLTSVYAVGRPQNSTMDVIVHELPVQARGSAAPDTVSTGTAGLVGDVSVVGAEPASGDADPGTTVGAAQLLGLLAVAAAMVVLVVLARRGPTAATLRSRRGVPPR